VNSVGVNSVGSELGRRRNVVTTTVAAEVG
jgi:hypothetical protein